MNLKFVLIIAVATFLGWALGTLIGVIVVLYLEKKEKESL